MNCYIINLDRSTDRFTYISRCLAGSNVNITRVSAIDGDRLTETELAHWQSRARVWAPMTAREIACFLSHRKTWKLVVERNEPWAFIGEDDIHITSNFARFLGVSTWLPMTADIVKAASATPNCRGSSTCASRICATGASSPVSRTRLLEALDELGQPLLEQVVSQIHDEVVVAEEVVGDQHAMCEPEWQRLRDVGDLHPPPRAISDRGLNLGACLAHDDADLANTCRGHVVEPVEENRAIRDGDELLGTRMRDRSETSAGSAAENESLHAGNMLGTMRTGVGARPSR